MVKPNFFIIGAPKCGTTSVVQWLRDHSNIFIPEFKEPHYFNTDHNFNNVYDLTHYEDLFSEANKEHKAVGEGSVWYLYSDAAVSNILDYNPEAKFLVLLRNPIDMAYSLHKQKVFSMEQPQKDFKKAWQAQFLSDKDLGGKFVREKKFLKYGDICKHGKYLTKLFKTVDRNRVLVIFLEDIKRDELKEYKKILDFLDVRYDNRIDFPVVNKAKKRKSYLLAYLTKTFSKIKRLFKIKLGFGLLNKIEDINRSQKERQGIDPQMQDSLKEYFAEDINKLMQIVGRDLSHWVE